MDRETCRVGVIGCGAISGIYLTTPKRNPIVEMAACADLDVERARVKAKEYGVPKACAVEELLADPAISIVRDALGQPLTATDGIGAHFVSWNKRGQITSASDSQGNLAYSSASDHAVRGGVTYQITQAEQALRKDKDLCNRIARLEKAWRA